MFLDNERSGLLFIETYPASAAISDQQITL